MARLGLLFLLAACASTGGSGEPLRYEDEEVAKGVAVYRTLLIRQYGEALSDPIEIQELDGPTSWDLLVREGENEPFGPALNEALRDLLARREARAFLYRLPSTQGIPEAALFVPWPASGIESELDLGPGFFLILGMAPPPSAPPGGERPTPKTWPVLEAIENVSTPYAVYVFLPGCRPDLFEELDRAAQGVDLLAPIYQADNASPVAARVKEMGLPASFPFVVYFEEGEIVDIHYGAHQTERTVRHFLARNGIIRADPASTLSHFPVPEGETRERWLRTLAAVKHWSGYDFRGADLRGLFLLRGSLSGSDLRDADLRNADLRHATLTRANFAGARMDGARTEGAFWRHAICPDGTRSEDHGGTCEGHLVPRDASAHSSAKPFSRIQASE